MAASYTFGRLPDGTILQLLDQLQSTMPSFEGNAAIGDLTITFDGSVPSDLFEPFSLGAGTYLVTRFVAFDRSTGLAVELQRGRQFAIVNGTETWVETPNGFTDGIKVTGPTTDPVNNGIPVFKLISALVPLAPPYTPDRDGFASQTATLVSSLQGVLATMVEHTAARQKELDAYRETLKAQATADLEEQRNRIESTLTTKRQELESLQESLEIKLKSIDDRSNTHVRRELQNKMANLSEERLKVRLLKSSELYFGLSLVLGFLAAGALGILIWSELAFAQNLSEQIGQIAGSQMIVQEARTAQLASLNQQIMFSQIRAVAQGVGLAALVWFMLRVSTTRYRQVSRWERELQKFRLDTERAGFLIEGDLEARKTGDEGLPAVMLDSFSRGLFSSDEQRGAADGVEPMGDALSALLGNAAKVQIGNSGVSVEVDRRGIRRAERTIGGSND